MAGEEQRDNSLQTIAIVLLCCGAAKLLHLLGVIAVEGEFYYSCNPRITVSTLSLWKRKITE